uniref:Glycosyltransferase n=1 Tax=Rhizophora mucronata TaxID=61149 RepID=A0A2P2PIR9_RHIMU
MQPHFLLVIYPVQGHINPALQFAKRLVRLGSRVTLATTVHASRRMAKTCFSGDLSLATYSDGFDDGFKPGDDPGLYLSECRRCGSQTLGDLILAAAKEGKPFTCVVVTLILAWAAEVARKHHVPTALLWIQPATVFDIYYHYFNGYDSLFLNCNDPTHVFELPGLPVQFTRRELPSLLFPPNVYTFILSEFKEQIDGLSKEAKPIILVNTFDALEAEALNAIEKYNQIAVGPLVPSAFLDGDDPLDTSFGGDLIQGSVSKEYCTEWLQSKPKSSVVYVSFGSYSVLSERQMQELARGLLACSHPFLWVIREKQQEGKADGKDEEKEGDAGEDPLLNYRKELEQQGVIVPWCSQIEVLSHPSIGCFVTHCGWNSTMEGLVSGVPMVAFPQWSDQGTNAKLIEDVWKTGVRVAANEEGIVDGDEIRSRLDLVMQSGEKGDEMRSNAKKWKHLARDAVKEDGSSYQNLKTFVDAATKGPLSDDVPSS